jgi:hypothetical protein
MKDVDLVAFEDFKRDSDTIEGLLRQLRPYCEGLEAKGIDATFMRGKIAGLEIALEMSRIKPQR